MIDIETLAEWLERLPEHALIGVDEGGLTLEAHWEGKVQDWIEIGGISKEEK